MEKQLGQGIFLVEKPPRARFYHCNTCGKLFIDTKMVPCPNCHQNKVNFVCNAGKNSPKLIVVVKGLGVP
jgi:rubrerythrin